MTIEEISAMLSTTNTFRAEWGSSLKGDVIHADNFSIPI